MNLKQLFEVQSVLDARIDTNHPVQDGEDRLEKKHAALLVELGEMFNEHRGFKFWSTDQTPNNNKYCTNCGGTGYKPCIRNMHNFNIIEEKSKECNLCHGKGYRDYLLEELVDCLHFILSIGLELEMDHFVVAPFTHDKREVEYTFIQLMQMDWTGDYETGFDLFLGLCKLLGYTGEQIEQAYFEKNEINHTRQEQGY